MQDPPVPAPRPQAVPRNVYLATLQSGASPLAACSPETRSEPIGSLRFDPFGPTRAIAAQCAQAAGVIGYPHGIPKCWTDQRWSEGATHGAHVEVDPKAPAAPADERESFALRRISSRRRMFNWGFPGAFLLTGLAFALGGERIGFTAFGASALGVGVLGARAFWSTCPRCGDHFFTGVLHSRNPKMSGLALRRNRCANCKLSLDGR